MSSFSGIRRWLVLMIFMISWVIGGQAAADLPLPNQWTEHGTVLPKGSNGKWDDTDVRMGCAIVFRDSIFLYYVGADHQRPDGDAGNMAIGLAKSANGVNFTKYSGNPLFTFRPTGDAEECAEFPQAVVKSDGTIWMYWGGDTSVGTGYVRCDIYLSTSTDGVHWSTGTKVIDYHDIGTGGGDEIWPIGLLHAQGGTATGTGQWHLWICGDRTPTPYSAKLAVSTDGLSWQEQNESPVLTDYLWQEGVCPVLHEDGSVTVLDFCGCEVGAGREIRFRSTHRNSLHSYSGVLGSFNDDPWWPGSVGIIADTSAGVWRMYWPKRSADIGGVINMKTASLEPSGTNQAPTASFTANPTSGVAPLVVNVNATASWDPNGDDLVYAWTVKKGSSTVATGSGVTWQYTFTTLGGFDIILVVTDDGEPALSDTASRAVQVLDQLSPTASFTANPSSGTYPFPLMVSFDASASDDPDGFIASYQWDFGDGSDSTLATALISHTYASPGSGLISVTLTVTDDDGASDSKNISLSYSQPGQELEVSNLSKTNYQVAYLKEGDQYYVDRLYALTGIPDEYDDLLWIKTANDDKTNSSESFLSFSVNQNVTAYVAYDHRASSLPNWIINFYTQTGDAIGVSDGDASPLSLWARDFPAGAITMGGNMASGASGAGSMYAVFLRGQGAPSDIDPPVISGVMATGISSSQATIGWSTDEPADSQVEYGLTTAYGSTTPLDEDLVTQHTVQLSGLSSQMFYHYRVRSADGAGNVSYSGDGTFQTAASGDIVAPQITNIQVDSIEDAQATVTWITDEVSDSQVEYGLTAAYGSATALDAALVTQHQVQLFGLTPETLYHYRVRSADGAGNVAYSDDGTFQTEAMGDVVPPVISTILVSALSDSDATIAWSTDEPADSRVEYGFVTGLYNWWAQDSVLTLNHQLGLEDLEPYTEYHFRVISQDQWGNLSASQDSSFITKQEVPGAPGKPEHFDD